jgi:hypothetical protein
MIIIILALVRLGEEVVHPFQEVEVGQEGEGHLVVEEDLQNQEEEVEVVHLFQAEVGEVVGHPSQGEEEVEEEPQIMEEEEY